MVPREETRWIDANQRHLAGAMAEVRAALERRAGRVETERTVEPPWDTVEGLGPRQPALEVFGATFGLSAFERGIVLLCAGVELSTAFADLCAEAQGDASRRLPTFSLALSALDSPHWSALAPSGPLRYWRLIEIVTQPNTPLTASPLRIDECILNFLTGVDHHDERLAGLIAPVSERGALVASHQALASRIVDAWGRPGGGLTPSPTLVEFCGADEASKRDIASNATAALGLGLNVLAAGDVPAGGAELESLARLCQRECVLTSGVLYVEAEGVDPADPRGSAVLSRFLERFTGHLFLASRTRWGALRRPMLRLDVGKPTREEQRLLWRVLVGPSAPRLNGHIDTLVGQFNLHSSAIRTAFGGVEAPGGGTECAPEALTARLWEASRAQARPRLDDLAQRIETTGTWDDLVVPAAEARMLRAIESHLAHRATVHDTWGFGAAGGRGLGLSTLFAGSSGTGKTRAAEILACSLRLDLYRLDLSCVVSKYIGETEKNLRRVFDAAEDGGAILFFDEADALFGKRGEVKDSHDRYANIEINYLLQRMESYRGLAVLATNRKGDLDSAFLRRLRFIVNFPFPEPAQRAAIWRRVFPRDTPTEGLDVDRLARLNVAGGSIRNIALHAAFLAAAAGTPVRMPHLLEAARGEFIKMEKPWTHAENEGW